MNLTSYALDTLMKTVFYAEETLGSIQRGLNTPLGGFSSASQAGVWIKIKDLRDELRFALRETRRATTTEQPTFTKTSSNNTLLDTLKAIEVNVQVIAHNIKTIALHLQTLGEDLKTLDNGNSGCEESNELGVVDPVPREPTPLENVWNARDRDLYKIITKEQDNEHQQKQEDEEEHGETHPDGWCGYLGPYLWYDPETEHWFDGPAEDKGGGGKGKGGAEED